MRFTTPRSSRLQYTRLSYTSKQQSRVSWLKILAIILIIWLCVISYWLFVIGLGQGNDDGYDMSANYMNPEIDALLREELSKHVQAMDSSNIIENRIFEQAKLSHDDRIWKPQALRKLDFQQPAYITEMIKSEYKRAEWHPKNDKKEITINYDILPKDYLNRIGYKNAQSKNEEKENNDKNDIYIKPSGNYKCLHYCNDDVYNYNCVLKHLEYWRKSQESPKTLQQIQQELSSVPLLQSLNNNVLNYPINSRGNRKS